MILTVLLLTLSCLQVNSAAFSQRVWSDPGIVFDESRESVNYHTIAVNRLLGYENRVAMTNRQTHLPDSLSNKQAYSFLEYFLNNESSK